MRIALFACAVLALIACAPSTPMAQDAGTDDGSIADASMPRDAYRAPDVGTDAGPIPDDLEGFIEYQMRVGRIPGLAAAILDHGAVVRVVTRGMANDTTPVDEHTLFTVASISKTFVCALILQLVEEGRIDLDAPASTYLGFSVSSDQAPGREITVRELMTHTSGITDDWIALGQVTVEGDPTTTLEEFSSEYVAVPAHFAAAPETQYDYCNACFGLLGAVIEGASGETVRARTQRLLVDPLMLDGAGWWLADVDAAHLAVEYTTGTTDADGNTTYRANPQRGFGHYTATSMHISITGLSRWLLGHIQDGTLDGAQFLSAESVAETRRIQYPAIASRQGLVWYRRSLAGSTWLGHSGESFGTSANMLYRDDGRGLVLLTNSDAYLRETFGRTEGQDAMNAILVRMSQEADALAATP